MAVKNKLKGKSNTGNKSGNGVRYFLNKKQYQQMYDSIVWDVREIRE